MTNTPVFGPYQLRSNKGTTYSIGFPKEIADRLPEGSQFTVEMTTEGVLYKMAGLAPDVTIEDNMPQWLKEVAVTPQPKPADPAPSMPDDEVTAAVKEMTDEQQAELDRLDAVARASAQTTP
jgi:hypothetical protein